MNLISTTNQQKVSVPIKQQIPFKLSSRFSVGGNSTVSSPPGHQMLPLKLCQDEKVRRSSTGYQRLGSDSFSPPSGETVIKATFLFLFAPLIIIIKLQTPTTTHSHIRTGSSPAMMQASPPHSSGTTATSSTNYAASGPKATRTNTYPKLPDKYKVKNDQQQPVDEEVIYFWRITC